MKNRCPWANPKNPLYVEYHDHEWGRPIFDDLALFEMLCLEGAQAGLSWETILNKRENYRKAFDGFNPAKMAKYSDKKMERLLQDKGIVRNRLKVKAFVENAKSFMTMQRNGESLSNFLWEFVDHKPILNKYATMKNVPSMTESAELMSKALKKKGFRFVGPTICYAFMQAVGMVNDHISSCQYHGKKLRRLDRK